MGIDVRKIVTITFFISGVCAAVAGVLVSGYYQMVYSTMGTEAGLKGFSAAVLGGIGVLHGSVIGGIVIGVAEALAVTFLGGSFPKLHRLYCPVYRAFDPACPVSLGKHDVDKV